MIHHINKQNETEAKIKFYVADDDEDIREIVKDTLEMHFNATVLEFESSEDLMDAVVHDEKAPDLIITDIKMPGEGGLSIPGRLAENGCAIPVLFITGVRHGEDLNDYSVLNKPFNMGDLTDRVHEMLEWFYTQKEVSREAA